MLMNSIEFWAMNNPIRGLVQKYYEIPRLRRLSRGQKDSVLEIGCEQGIGRPLRKILDHPYDQMFRQREFLDQLEAIGFATESYEEKPLGFYHFWGKATKTR
ncbi:MAG: DUF3332 domain-containing protein [Gammaproteobacteria bacterium]|nr:DUF3332 domain-containing protein [Gammaproteobacteria bacterium]MBT8111275.1 DUF3332 domain-containing protein [Gammaproteobacteria bacterium]NNL45973.1 hypothetical protein [Woeseiaceae bacterium]